VKLVAGSETSSNSKRLVEVALTAGVASYLIDDAGDIDPAWLEGVETVGITSGASAPEELVRRLVEFFRARGVDDVSEFEVVQEDVRFMLPKTIRQAMAEAS
jgi:4-hydroxy-3-methylbut-2-enyl diphosphate reductase